MESKINKRNTYKADCFADLGAFCRAFLIKLSTRRIDCPPTG